MEMWLKRAALVLCVVAGAATGTQRPIILDDKPSSPVEVPPGSSLTFRCQLSNKGMRYRVFWYFNSSEPNINETQMKCDAMVDNSSKNTSEQPQLDGGKDCQDDTWNLTNVNETNAGWYFCEIRQEIPTVQSYWSKEKYIVISKRLAESTTYLSLVTSKQVNPNSNPLHDYWWLWTLLGASSLILIILLVACIVKRQRARRSRAEEPIYINTHCKLGGGSSPRPGQAVNSLKTGSSAQNLSEPRTARRYEEGTLRKKH